VSLGKSKYYFYIALLTLVTGLAIAPRSAFANEDNGRKVKSKVSPTYPDLAKRMNVTGTVKVQVVVAANGTVKSTKVIGGHPLLVEPSVDAIKKWKYEPSNEDTTTTVEFVFNGTNN
jgi:TonB family protein